jgi:2-polyprenyl-3-methyl-5-hydroxy-6-metoxy-1,4-benzoquinol methylase
MACTCTDVALDEVFTERFARKDAAHYRKHGLQRRAHLLLELVTNVLDVRGRRTLEGGAGTGALTIELARRGASSAAAVDAVPIAITSAKELANEFGVADRTQFIVGDFADPQLAALPADLVILDRVLCCYPDWRGLLGNAVKRAQHVVALTYPADTRISRLAVRAVNALQAMFRRHFRLQFHSPDMMLGMLRQHGFAQIQKHRYWTWEIAVASRV